MGTCLPWLATSPQGQIPAKLKEAGWSRGKIARRFTKMKSQISFPFLSFFRIPCIFYECILMLDRYYIVILYKCTYLMSITISFTSRLTKYTSFQDSLAFLQLWRSKTGDRVRPAILRPLLCVLLDRRWRPWETKKYQTKA